MTEAKKNETELNYWLLIGVWSVVFLGLLSLNPDRVAAWKQKLETRRAALAGTSQASSKNVADEVRLSSVVLKEEGIRLPINWGNLGQQLIAKGVIDEQKFTKLYGSRGGLSEQEKTWLQGETGKEIVMNLENSSFWLNMFWAFGLANKNELVLEQGPMMMRGDASGFASTGGWTISQGKVMDHYSRYELVVLTPEQQKLVKKVADGIFRPCCNNPTSFPDCNHGMAMLGLLELMVANGASEEEMYRVALQVNAYWFPDTYLTLARYFESRGISWQDVNPRTVLGKDYSSASGYSQVRSQVAPVEQGSGATCGV